MTEASPTAPSDRAPLSDSAVEAAAAVLVGASRSGVPIAHLAPAPATVDDGYRIQWAGHRLARQSLGPWKIGATTSAAQEILGVDGPFIGRPAPDRVLASGAEIDLAEWFIGAAGIEIEVGLVPRVDLHELSDDPMDLAPLVDVVPCLELVNSRFTDMRTVGVASLIADNAVASAIVQGEPMGLSTEQVQSLDTVAVSVEIDGTEAAAGTGSMALGHPLNVLHHAALMALGWGTSIDAGALVITGTCTGLIPSTPGTQVTGRVGESVVTAAFR